MSSRNWPSDQLYSFECILPVFSCVGFALIKCLTLLRPLHPKPTLCQQTYTPRHKSLAVLNKHPTVSWLLLVDSPKSNPIPTKTEYWNCPYLYHMLFYGVILLSDCSDSLDTAIATRTTRLFDHSPVPIA